MLIILGANGGLGGGLVRHISARPAITAEFGELLANVRSDVDLSDEQSVLDFFKRVDERAPRGEPFHLVNATGVSINGFAHKMSVDSFDRTVDVNLRGAFLVAKHAQPLVKERPGSSLLFLSSVVPELGVAGTVAYAASKAGLRGLVRTLAAEFARLECRVNALELGYFATGMIDQVSQSAQETLRSTIPLGRFGSVEELYAACEFTFRCGYLTGSALKINGGLA